VFIPGGSTRRIKVLDSQRWSTRTPNERRFTAIDGGMRLLGLACVAGGIVNFRRKSRYVADKGKSARTSRHHCFEPPGRIKKGNAILKSLLGLPKRKLSKGWGGTGRASDIPNIGRTA
jgi:hypothetical protein